MSTQNENTPGDKDFGIYIRSGKTSEDVYAVKSKKGREFLNEFGNSPSFEDIGNRINAYLKYDTEGFTQNELDDLQHFKRMAGLSETGHGEDEYAGSSVYDGTDLIYSKYLRKNVLPNILDGYNVPGYVFTLYMLKADKYKQFINGTANTEREDGFTDSESARDDAPKEKITYTNRSLSKPGAGDRVIIAQTGTTDIGIDDVDIESFNGVNNDITPALISFKLTEPGSITLLDRLAEAKNFCGYPSDTVVLPGMFLELKFRGYTDTVAGVDRDQGGQAVSVPFVSELVDKEEAYYELGGITYDMQITPEGATYNFQAYRQKSGGLQGLRLNTPHTLTGRNLTELFGGEREDKLPPSQADSESSDTKNKKPEETNKAYGLEQAIILDLQSLDEKANSDKSDSNNIRREFTLDMSGLISNQNDNVNLTGDTISDTLLTDYQLLETFAKSGTIVKRDEAGNKDGYNWTENDFEDNPDTEKDETYNGRTLTDSIQVGGATADITIDQNLIDGSDVYTDPFISINIPAGTHIKDCIYLILSLSDDFVNKALKYDQKDLHKKELVIDKGYARWVMLDSDHYYDYSDYDDATKTFAEYIVVKPVLSYNSNPNMILSTEELKSKSPEQELKEMKTRLDSLNIMKEYYYSFTGKNDQVIDINFDFNEAFALTIPALGFGDYAMQSAMATATFLKEEEAGKNTQKNTGVADDIGQRQKATGILDTLKELGDDELSNFADYIGFSDEEKKRLINEKNANGTGVRGSEGWRFEDQEMLKSLAGALSVDGVGDAIASGYTSTSAQTNPTEGDTTIIESVSGTQSTNIYASALVMGLEGYDQSAQWSNGDDDAKEFVRSIKPRVVTVESENIVKEAPDERGSIRQTAMSHLMRASSNAASHMSLDLSIRGDTDWLGNDIFYNIAKDQDGRLDFIKSTHDAFFIMEAPRKLDNNVNEEDNNTGLFDFGNINYTMSGVYFITRLVSNFSNGLFTQTLNMLYNSKYDMSKIETLRKDEKQYADFYNDEIETDENSPNYGKRKGHIQKSYYQNMIDGLFPGDSPTSSDVAWTGETTTNPARASQGDGVAYRAPDGSIIHNGRIVYQGRIW